MILEISQLSVRNIPQTKNGLFPCHIIYIFYVVVDVVVVKCKLHFNVIAGCGLLTSYIVGFFHICLLLVFKIAICKLTTAVLE